MWFTGLIDEEEGALKGNNSIEKVIHVIEKIRCAYKTDRQIKLEKDTWKWFKESVSVTDFNELYDNENYKYIYVSLEEDVEALQLPDELTYKPDDNHFAEIFRGEVVKFDFSPLVILVDKEHGNSLANYMQPSDEEFRNQRKQFIKEIAEKYNSGNYSRAKVIGLLSKSSQCLYEYLTKEQRYALLDIIANGTNIPEEVERIVIDIIRTTKENQIDYLLKKLYDKKLIGYFDEVINDYGGKNYYTKFMMELLKLYSKKYFDELKNCYSTTNYGKIFLKVTIEQENFGNLRYIKKSVTPFYKWDKNCDYPTLRYNDYNLEFSNSTTCGYYNDAKPEINPFEPIVVYFEQDVAALDLPEAKKDRVIAMPAFLLSYFRTKAHANTGAEMLQDAIVIYSSCLTLGQGALAAKGFPRVLLNAWNYLLKVDAVVQILLTNEDIKNTIENIGENNEGAKFINKYQEYSPYFKYLTKPTIENVLLKQNVNNILQGYKEIAVLWDIIRGSEEIEDALEEIEINKITKNLEKINKALNNEEIVE